MKFTLVLSFCILLCISCTQEKLFQKIPSSKSGIDFNNSIKDNDSFNVLTISNLYNGAGIGVGDFNNDGLQDLFFAGNIVSNKLYLNKGNLSFDDVTEISRTTGEGRFCRGVVVVDINNDNLLDIYVCLGIGKDTSKTKNLLYINMGNNTNGIPIFKEQAKEYGIDDISHTSMGSFFDMDNDGDLDLILIVNEIDLRDPPDRFREIKNDGSNPSTSVLYECIWNEELNHPIYKNISKIAGILWEGYSHGINVSDLNLDGWKDIYISNDFVSQNVLYMNQKNGTFKNYIKDVLKHGSATAMGNNIIDINNDGRSDIIELDMNPEDNYRKKMTMNRNNYMIYLNSDKYGYQYQYVRNTLQLNRGLIEMEEMPLPAFSDIVFYSQLAFTDWSWCPLVADLDNDGWRDIFITNGYPKDVTDHDFISYRNRINFVASPMQLLQYVPNVKIKNYFFHNNKDLTFTDKTEDWGIEDFTFSNGAVHADLDNDGDLDIVINNINDKALLYENKLNENRKKNNSYLKITLQYTKYNRQALGAWVKVYSKGTMQVYENNPYRGYLSSVDPIIHFGLDTCSKVDSVVVYWPNQTKQTLINVKTNRHITIQYKPKSPAFSWKEFFPLTPKKEKIFNSVPLENMGLEYVHQEKDFIDFMIQRLLPHKFSEYGPIVLSGDVDNNGLEDIFIGNSDGYLPSLYLQNKAKKFVKKENPIPHYTRKETTAGLLLDLDKDKDLDIILLQGGYEYVKQDTISTISFYINQGNGDYIKQEDILIKGLHNKTVYCTLKANDYDKDGDMDIFIGGRVKVGAYPDKCSSYILENQSTKKKILFSNVTHDKARGLENIGLVCDAVWTDINQDSWMDLIVVGEWMPITIFMNDKGKSFLSPFMIENSQGWWNSILSTDYDKDGDMDYIVGNLGLNTFYSGNKKYPAKIYYNDFDSNGVWDAVPTLYLKDFRDGRKPSQFKEFPAQGRDDFIDQFIKKKKQFYKYNTFAKATFKDIFSKETIEKSLQLQANNMASSIFVNEGNNTFKIIPLPKEAQLYPIFGMVAEDFDNDGNIDIILNGNDYGMEVSVGRYDAGYGLMLKGNNNKNFSVLPLYQSGIVIPYNGKNIIKVARGKKDYILVATQNRNSLKIFEPTNNNHQSLLNFEKCKQYILIHYKDGRVQRVEKQIGNSFTSQQANIILINKNLINNIEWY